MRGRVIGLTLSRDSPWMRRTKPAVLNVCDLGPSSEPPTARRCLCQDAVGDRHIIIDSTTALLAVTTQALGNILNALFETARTSTR